MIFVFVIICWHFYISLKISFQLQQPVVRSGGCSSLPAIPVTPSSTGGHIHVTPHPETPAPNQWRGGLTTALNTFAEMLRSINTTVGNFSKKLEKLDSRMFKLEDLLKEIQVRQMWEQTMLCRLCEGKEDIPEPPQPPTEAPRPPSPVTQAEEVLVDPVGLPDVEDTGYMPTVCATKEEFDLQDQFLQMNSREFNELVARWGREKPIYATKTSRKWGAMYREMMDRLMTIELQATFNWAGVVGACSDAGEKFKFQDTQQASLLMKAATLRSRLYSNPHCTEAVKYQQDELHKIINHATERVNRHNKQVTKATSRLSTDKVEFSARQHAKAQSAKKKRNEHSLAKQIDPNAGGAEYATMNNDQ